MSQAMKIKQLELNVDKSGVIIFGNKKTTLSLKNEIESKQCLKIDGLKVKVKSQDKYLRDYLLSQRKQLLTTVWSLLK